VSKPDNKPDEPPTRSSTDRTDGTDHHDGEHEPGIDGLSVLGHTVRHALDHVECFPRPDGCTRVRFKTEEVSSICPVTGQPDLSSVVIDYKPDAWCVESKSLKLYLWSFRDRPVFAEALAAEIAGEIHASARPQWVRVVVTQRPRGGIELQTTSELGESAPPDDPAL
jgi:7-cyano-7-deazaguanine reductase